MTKNFESANICKLLSYESRVALVKASQVKTDRDPLARVKAVEAAAAQARLYQPRMFS